MDMLPHCSSHSYVFGTRWSKRPASLPVPLREQDIEKNYPAASPLNDSRREINRIDRASPSLLSTYSNSDCVYRVPSRESDIALPSAANNLPTTNQHHERRRSMSLGKVESRDSPVFQAIAVMNSLHTLEKTSKIQQTNSKTHLPQEPLPIVSISVEQLVPVNDFLEVHFRPGDKRNPHNWPKYQRWLYTVLVGATMFNATFASTVANGASSQIAPHFGLSETERILVSTIFVGGCVAGPIVWAPLSEIKGRRFTYLVSTAIYTFCNVGCALAPSKQVLLLFRFLSGAFASSALTNAGGVVTDLFPPAERGNPMMIFSLGPFIGPVFGPLVGGAISVNLSWHWVFWLLLISGCILEVLLLLLPETYAPLILSQMAAELRGMTADPRWQGPLDKRDKRLGAILMVNLGRPINMMLTEPIVTVAIIYTSFIFALMYIFFASWPFIFGPRGIYVFDPVKTGLAFMPMGVGGLIAALVTPLFTRFYVKSCKKAKGPCPEARLPPAFFVGPFIAVGLFWSGWTASPKIHWIVPMIASIPIGAAMVLVFQGWLTYLGDCYRVYASSAIAATVIARSLAGALLPLLSRKLMLALGGIHWMYTLLAFLSLVISPLPFLFYRYGARLRAKSSYLQ